MDGEDGGFEKEKWRKSKWEEKERVFRRVGIYSPDLHIVTSGEAIVTFFSSS